MKLPIFIVIASIILVVSFSFAGRSKQSESSTADIRAVQEVPANNVTMTDGKQIVEIKARGGYSPRLSIAKAGVPTIIRFNTNNTFDCSASVRIPSLNISKMLPSTGTTDIDVGTPKAGTLQVLCGMAMYYFTVDFQN